MYSLFGSKTEIWSVYTTVMLAGFPCTLMSHQMDLTGADKVIEQALKMAKDIPTRRNTEDKSTRAR